MTNISPKASPHVSQRASPGDALKSRSMSTEKIIK